MSYITVAGVTQSLSLVFFMVLFIGVVIYALWPGNREEFEHAARLPLEADPDDLNKVQRAGGNENG